MKKHVAPVLAAVALLGVVGGVAAAQALGSGHEPAQRQVEVVQPAAQTVTPSATTTTTTPIATTTTAPVPVKTNAPAVPSTKSSSTAPSTVQRQAVVNDPTPETTTQDQPATPGSPPPVRWGSDVPTPPTSAK